MIYTEMLGHEAKSVGRIGVSLEFLKSPIAHIFCHSRRGPISLLANAIIFAAARAKCFAVQKMKSTARVQQRAVKRQSSLSAAEFNVIGNRIGILMESNGNEREISRSEREKRERHTDSNDIITLFHSPLDARLRTDEEDDKKEKLSFLSFPRR